MLKYPKILGWYSRFNLSGKFSFFHLGENMIRGLEYFTQHWNENLWERIKSVAAEFLMLWKWNFLLVKIVPFLYDLLSTSLWIWYQTVQKINVVEFLIFELSWLPCTKHSLLFVPIVSWYCYSHDWALISWSIQFIKIPMDWNNRFSTLMTLFKIS